MTRPRRPQKISNLVMFGHKLGTWKGSLEMARDYCIFYFPTTSNHHIPQYHREAWPTIPGPVHLRSHIYIFIYIDLHYKMVVIYIVWLNFAAYHFVNANDFTYTAHHCPRWFKPEEQMGTLQDWMSQEACLARRRYHLLDLFGGSRKMQRSWDRDGWCGISYDIRLSEMHDITSESGFRHLCQISLR